MQTQDVTEARKLYDQLIPLGPIMLALTASTTVWNGILADTDVRWNVMSASMDDRSFEESAAASSHNENNSTLRPRYWSNDTYISEDPRLLNEYQDPNVVFNEEAKQQLLDGGMDDLLATHFAFLFARDPLAVFAKDVGPDAPEGTALFEAVQSTNYNTVRFKPPPSLDSKHTGWRVEFRPMEVQMTDFENAAFAIFIVLVSRVILHYDLNLYMPISTVDDNMEKAHSRDAVNCERFYFRTDPMSQLRATLSPTGADLKSPTIGPDTDFYGASIDSSSDDSITSETPKGNSPSEASASQTSLSSFSSGVESPIQQQDKTNASKRTLSDVDAVESTSPKRPCLTRSIQLPTPPLQQNEKPSTDISYQKISSIINGNDETGFPGLIPLVKRYLDETNIFDTPARAKVDHYLALVAARASGKAWTAAKWQREFVRRHKDYKKDSLVGQKVMYDLLKAVKRMETEDGRREVAGDMFVF
ncbi:MAG: hypothetical protein Q9166_002354 [cf. Caloplaca sp. 2 TL-2023]